MATVSGKYQFSILALFILSALVAVGIAFLLPPFERAQHLQDLTEKIRRHDGEVNIMGQNVFVTLNSEGFTDADLKSVLSQLISCPRLKQLDLRGTRLSDESLDLLLILSRKKANSTTYLDIQLDESCFSKKNLEAYLFGRLGY